MKTAATIGERRSAVVPLDLEQYPLALGSETVDGRFAIDEQFDQPAITEVSIEDRVLLTLSLPVMPRMSSTFGGSRVAISPAFAGPVTSRSSTAVRVDDCPANAASSASASLSVSVVSVVVSVSVAVVVLSVVVVSVPVVVFVVSVAVSVVSAVVPVSVAVPVVSVAVAVPLVVDSFVAVACAVPFSVVSVVVPVVSLSVSVVSVAVSVVSVVGISFHTLRLSVK